MSEKNSTCEPEKPQSPNMKLVFPDGGWGWIVVIASGISNFINIPVMQSFALIFKDRIFELNMSNTDLATIININAAFGMGLGLLGGPLMQKFGYRKVAIFGALSASIGITVTSWASTFVEFIIFYSLITSMGTFLVMSSFSIAVNTYFSTRRGYASGMSTTLTGLGPVVMPQVITLLLHHYKTQGCMMILGALSLHSVVGAFLLQPVEWHMKKVPIEEEVDGDDDKDNDDCSQNGSENLGKAVIVIDGHGKRKRYASNSTEYEKEVDTLSLYGMETPIVVHRQFGSTQQLSKRRKSTIEYYRSTSMNDDSNIFEKPVSKRLSQYNEPNKPKQNVKVRSKTKVSDEKEYIALEPTNYDISNGKFSTNNEAKITISDEVEQKSIDDKCDNGKPDEKLVKEEETKEEQQEEQKRGPLKRILMNISDFFGLDLLRDPAYVILMLGMSLAISSELNYSLFTPLILGDFGFDTQKIATIMSIVAFNDLVFRFLAPFICGRTNFSPQTIYLFSLISLITARSGLMFFHDYKSAIIVACMLGCAKGFRTVYMSIVIPSYLPLDRLAHGSGIQSVVNCLCIVLSIPVIAIVREKTGSYNLCIAAINCVTLITVVMWTVQILYNKFKKKSKDVSVS